MLAHPLPADMYVDVGLSTAVFNSDGDQRDGANTVIAPEVSGI